jgi:putative transposase
VINRGNARAQVFHKDEDLEAFVRIMGEAGIRVPMRVVAYCLMTNHFHLVLWPRADGDLSRWMHWLLTTHVRRYLHHYRHSGHVWQGRFKAFPIQQDEHLLTVVRYVERNPLRAGLVERAQDWRWSSLRPDAEGPSLDPGPTPRGANWLEFVNTPMTEAEVAAIRLSLRRDRPYGTDAWTNETAGCLGLEYSIRARGRQPRLSTQR